MGRTIIVLLATLAIILATACQKKEGEGQAVDQTAAADTAKAAAQAGTQAATPPAPPEPQGIPAPADVAAPPADAQKTATGIASKVLQPGTGTGKPTAESFVKVHYTGWTTDGKMFDSSIVRDKPALFPLKGVIPGWTEGLQLMTVGEKRRLWIPETLAYKGQPGRPAGTLVFDVELLEIITPPATPADVAAAPADAKKTASGLAYKVLTPGTGKVRPTATSKVKAHYTGWLTSGEMFDSSVVRGEPATFPLDRVIPGWGEGVQLMVEGEKTRFWIPVELAYNNRPGAPPGMLVFDVELLSIEPEAPQPMPGTPPVPPPAQPK